MHATRQRVLYTHASVCDICSTCGGFVGWDFVGLVVKKPFGWVSCVRVWVFSQMGIFSQMGRWWLQVPCCLPASHVGSTGVCTSCTMACRQMPVSRAWCAAAARQQRLLQKHACCWVQCPLLLLCVGVCPRGQPEGAGGLQRAGGVTPCSPSKCI